MYDVSDWPPNQHILSQFVKFYPFGFINFDGDLKTTTPVGKSRTFWPQEEEECRESSASRMHIAKIDTSQPFERNVSCNDAVETAKRKHEEEFLQSFTGEQ